MLVEKRTKLYFSQCFFPFHCLSMAYNSKLNLLFQACIFFICSTTFITCPADPKKTLGIKLPFLVMIIKNLKKYFTFEVQVINMYMAGWNSRAKTAEVPVAWSFLSVTNTNLTIYSFVDTKVLDDKNVKRRFRASNYQSTTRVKPFICTMPMRLDDGWNQIQVNFLPFFALHPWLQRDNI